MNSIAITPEMLLGALVIFAFLLLVGAVLAIRWVRAAVRFGSGFQTFNATRERNRINVTATFDDGSRRPKARSIWEIVFPPPTQAPAPMINVESQMTVEPKGDGRKAE